MSNQKVSAPKDIFSVINSHFTEQLASRTIPWHISWNEHPKDINGQLFRGINVWLLALAEYSRNVFVTKEHMKAHKLSPKKKEQGHIVITSEKSNNRKSVGYQKVYNVDQVEGLDRSTLPPFENEKRSIKRCSDIVDRMPNLPTVIDYGAYLHYDFEQDTIYLPLAECFENDRQLYSALFYALVQSTGHPKRLHRETCEHRDLLAPKLFSCEDLVAEMGCSILCSYAGIDPWYLNKYHANANEKWLQKMQNDITLVSMAAMRADEAVEYILNIPQIELLKDRQGM